MPIDESRFRQTMGYFASGVTVVTTEYAQKLYGVTVSSLTSLSLNPPLILICLDHSLRTLDAVLGRGQFVINILDQRQEHLSRRFATREEDKFTGVAWQRGHLELPILDGALAVIECQVFATHPGGDHTIIVGEVLASAIGDGTPLLYYRRGYHELQ